MSEIAVVIPAAGSSTRFGGKQSKVFAPLLGKPVWQWSVDIFARMECVKQIVLVLSASEVDTFKATMPGLANSEKLSVTTGGATRAESVLNGLRCTADSIDALAVHDAARPLVTQEWIESLFALAEQNSALLPVVPVTSTVKRVSGDDCVEATIDREPLRLAQTPQVFSRHLLIDAYTAVKNFAMCTDDAAVVEQSGATVKTVPGLAENIKITTPDDLALAEFWLQRREGH